MFCVMLEFWRLLLVVLDPFVQLLMLRSVCMIETFLYIVCNT
jgi:hypothetical protein